MPELNASIALATPSIAYDAWKKVLDRICLKRLSLSLYDLPAFPTHDAYAAGTGPSVFFEDTMLPRLRKEHGALIDELLSEAPDHEDLLDEPIHGDY